jgi:secondary thiamine-phosphate synthase enzyme
MSKINVYCDRIEVRLDTGPDVVDISSGLQKLVAGSGIRQGSLAATMTGSTGSLTTIEYEPGVVEDLKRAITALAPPGQTYQHELAWHDGNGHSHIQAALMGPSIALAVREGRLSTGIWQQVVAINHDNRPRSRVIEVTIIGI